MKKNSISLHTLQKKIDIFAEYVDSHEFDLPLKDQTLDGLNETLQMGDSLTKKVRQIATEIKTKTSTLIIQQKNSIIADAVLKMSPEELIEFSNKLKKQQQDVD